MKKDRRGGARKGAGRKSRYGVPMKPVTVTLPPQHIATLKRLGDGNLSAGIQLLVESSAQSVDDRQ